MSRALLNPELCVFDRRLQRSQLWCTPSAPSAPSGSVTHSTGSASRSVRGSLLAVASLGRCFARRQGAPSKCIVNSHKAIETAEQIVSRINDNFVLWLVLVTLTAISFPETFMWVKQEWFTWLLGLLMFSVGLTTSVEDFRSSMKSWLAVVINSFACFVIMPALAYTLAVLIRWVAVLKVDSLAKKFKLAKGGCTNACWACADWLHQWWTHI
eukprot:symbB.v1.2.026503.t1/scaffold2653.1/size73901/7